jgi:hypothetical protein
MFKQNWFHFEHFAIQQKSKDRILNLINYTDRNESFPRFVRLISERPTAERPRTKLPIELSPIHNLIVELRHMAHQTPPSAWLTNALTTDGNVVGVDDILQFLVFGFVFANSQFRDAGLKQSKFGYLTTQLGCALA